jgi:kinesin family protein 18/19
MTMQELFERVGELKETKDCEVTLSYLEIYNETIRDLLDPNASEKKTSLMLREDSQQAVSVAGLTSHKPQNVQEVMDMVIQGNAQRTQSPTEANATSSRSHAVLQVNVALKDRDASVHEPVTFATLSIIDLAGSERASATKNRGARLLEGANINKSLLSLGSCINALCDPRKKNHVPYRNSKLTRLLKFSLGGNCRTVMIVCVSPSSQHFDETQNTLRYANRAKNIQTKSVRNVYNVDRHVKDYLKKIDEQMVLINELRAQIKDYETHAFAKFRKAEAKMEDLLKDGTQRIRAAYDHSAAERKERTQTMCRLRQAERRIGAISGWVGAFDQVCDTREGEEPAAALGAMRKTATGILAELENSRQHYHQRLAKNNWTRAIDTALQDGLRQLQANESFSPDCAEAASLHREVEILKNRADLEMNAVLLEQEKAGEAGLFNVMLTTQFETIAIINQLLHMSDEEAIQAGREVMGKLLSACTDASAQVIKPDGSLQVGVSMPSARSGMARRQSLMGPSAMKSKIRQSGRQSLSRRQSLSMRPAPSAVPTHVATELQPRSSSPTVPSSPTRSSTIPKRRVKLGGTARKGAAFSGPGTPKKKSQKKRAVRWRDESAEDGAEPGKLVEFQPTPKPLEPSPMKFENEDSQRIDPPNFRCPIPEDGEPNSSPIPAAPVPRSETASEMRRAGTGRFALGALTKNKADDGSPRMPPPPTMSLGSFSSEDESSPLRDIGANRAPFSSLRAMSKHNMDNSSDGGSVSNGSDVEQCFSDRESAHQIRKAMARKKRSSLSGGSAFRPRTRDSTHRRRSPPGSGHFTASSPPPSDTSFSASQARRMVGSTRDESARSSILSPRSQAIAKGPMVRQRQSMFDMNSPRDSTGSNGRPPVRVSSSAAAANGVGGGPKPAWR